MNSGFFRSIFRWRAFYQVLKNGIRNNKKINKRLNLNAIESGNLDFHVLLLLLFEISSNCWLVVVATDFAKMTRKRIVSAYSVSCVHFVSCRSLPSKLSSNFIICLSNWFVFNWLSLHQSLNLMTNCHWCPFIRSAIDFNLIEMFLLFLCLNHRWESKRSGPS